MPPQQKIPVASFTAVGKGIAREIVLDVGLSLPDTHNQVDAEVPDPTLHVKALWDTGATNCAITKATAEKLGLVPISFGEVHHAGGKSLKPIYAVSLYLPNRFRIPYLRATECESTAGNFDFIVGMEIISMGDLAITNAGGKTVISFRMPSLKTVDFNKELEEHGGVVRTDEKVGRNDPCPCGSGKKYKHCHGA